ncbi:hypothetical protein [Paenibacillus sp. 1011MAR3C5]|nr:hypothetical protein [Paenibacillus sp. 1011MAR3C5]
MRAILMTLLLIITAVVVYTSVAEGDDGLNEGVGRTGGAMGEYIKGMSP